MLLPDSAQFYHASRLRSGSARAQLGTKRVSRDSLPVSAVELSKQRTRYVRYRKHLIDTAATAAAAAERKDRPPTMLLRWRPARLEHLLEQFIAHAAHGLALGHGKVQ